MADFVPTVLVMAAGTGGHVFPALAIASCLRRRGARVEWLGTRHGMENKLLDKYDYPLHAVSVKGLRGSGLMRLILAPWMLLRALIQSWRVMRRVQPDCVLGMGGFVCGPAGLAAKLQRRPLVIHEQNAVAGLTNGWLARWADRVLEAFPGTFKQRGNVVHTGNPVRAELLAVATPSASTTGAESPLRVLVLGGSQGALAINRVIPALLADWEGPRRPQVLHQTGERSLAETRQAYSDRGIETGDEVRVQAFIDDMAAAYAWSDVVVCRSGASTVSELAALGMPAILVPYPYHRDQQQTLNARWLSDSGAALLLQQADLSAAKLHDVLSQLDADRGSLRGIAMKAQQLGKADAAETIAAHCLEVAGV